MCKQPVLAFYWSRPLIYEGPHIGFQFHEGNSEFNSEECNSDSNSNSNDGNSNSIPIPPGLGKANSNSIPIPELDLELARKSNSGAELTPTLAGCAAENERKTEAQVDGHWTVSSRSWDNEIEQTIRRRGAGRCRDQFLPAVKFFPPPVTLPSVLSAVCIVQNWYLADSLLIE